MSLALRATGLSLAYGTVRALCDVGLELLAGERVGVIGRSGSGKTGLARLLAGLPPVGASVSGALSWPGGSAELASLTPAERRKRIGGRIGWLPQEAQAALNPFLRLGGQVAETLRAAGRPADRDAVWASFAAVELDPGLRDRYPHQVSGGQAQRVALACALAQAPSVLIADEPTSALDGHTAAAILALLRRASAERVLALVLVTHELEAAAGCDRLLVLDAGEVVEQGRAGEVLAAPRSAAAQRLVVAGAGLAGRVRRGC